MSRVKHCLTVMLLIACVAGGLGSRAFAGDDSGRKAKSRVEPTYPELARRMHIAGTVRVEVTVAPSGAVKNAKVIGGNPVLAESSVEAVKKWRFEAAPEDTTQIIEFHFSAQ